MVEIQKTAVGGVFTVECRGADGNLKWTEDFHNLVVNEGLQYLNTQVFTGINYSATWYMGLVTGPGAGNTYAGTDTMLSHAGWAEDINYSQSARPTLSFGTATTADPSVISTASAALFSITGTTTIAGAFITNESTKNGSTGVLFSVGNFTVGDRPVVSGDTVNVTYSFSADAA